MAGLKQPQAKAPAPLIVVVDDDAAVRESIAALLEVAGFQVRSFAASAALLADRELDKAACILIDVFLGEEQDGIDLLAKLRASGRHMPVLMLTAHGDVPMAVRAIRAGAVDFIEKPFAAERLLAAIRDAADRGAVVARAAALVARLSPRERLVMRGLVAGKSNKVIAADCGISPRTIEVHRAALMDKLEVRSVADVVRLALMFDPASSPR